MRLPKKKRDLGGAIIPFKVQTAITVGCGDKVSVSKHVSSEMKCSQGT